MPLGCDPLVPLLVILPGAAYMIVKAVKPPPDDVMKTIREAGFDPVMPPTRLRGPGGIYQVDGKSYRVVCAADPSLVKDKLRKSPTEDRVRTRLESGGFSLAGDYLAKINGKLGGDRLTSIQYSLTNVAISEIPMADLFDIQEALLSQPSCARMVGQLVKASKQVCAGYAALSATTSYKVNMNTKLAAQEESKGQVLEAVKTAIEEHAGSEISIRSADELKGDDLYYGIQLSQLCITPDTATEPSVLTQTPQATAGEHPGSGNKLAAH